MCVHDSILNWSSSILWQFEYKKPNAQYINVHIKCAHILSHSYSLSIVHQNTVKWRRIHNNNRNVKQNRSAEEAKKKNKHTSNKKKELNKYHRYSRSHTTYSIGQHGILLYNIVLLLDHLVFQFVFFFFSSVPSLMMKFFALSQCAPFFSAAC